MKAQDKEIRLSTNAAFQGVKPVAVGVSDGSIASAPIPELGQE